jgi:hypothetical protein
VFLFCLASVAMHISITAIVTRIYSMAAGIKLCKLIVYIVPFIPAPFKLQQDCFWLRLLVVFNNTMLWDGGKAHNTKLFVFFAAIIKHRFTGN